ncbi:monocarboxylate transporter 4-like [Argonauta hians]
MMGEVTEDPVLNIPETIAEVDDKEIINELEESNECFTWKPTNLVEENVEANTTMASGDTEKIQESLPNIPTPPQNYAEPLSPSELLRSKLIENVSIKMLDSLEMSKGGASPFLGRRIENDSVHSTLKKAMENNDKSDKRKAIRSNTYMDTTEFSKNSGRINNAKIPETVHKRKNTVTGAPESRKMSTLSLSKVFTPSIRKDSISRFVSTLSISTGFPAETSFFTEIDSRKSSLGPSRKYSEVSLDLQPGIERGLSILSVKPKPKYSKTKKFMILISSFLMQIFVSEIFSFGPIYVKLLEVFNSSKLTTSLIQSLPQGTAYACSVFIGPFVSRYGIRTMLFISGILTSIGFAGAAFMDNVLGIALLIGIVSGIGLCILNIVSFSAIAIYFESGQNYAIAAVSSGLALGYTLLPFYHIGIIEFYGWNGNFLLMAGIILQTCIMSFQFEKQTVKKATDNRSPKTENEVKFKEKLQNISKFKALPSLFVATYFLSSGGPIFSMMITDFGIERGYSMHDSTIFLMTYSLCTVLGRLLAGISSACRVSGMSTCLLSTTMCTFFVIGVTLPQDYNLIVVVLVFVGLFMGCSATTVLVALLEMVGSENYQFCFRIHSTIVGFGYFTCGPLAGFVADLTKSYSMSFVTSGLFMAVFVSLNLLTILLTGQKHLLHRRIPVVPIDHLGDTKPHDNIP